MIEIDKPKQVNNALAQAPGNFKVIVYPHRRHSQPVTKITEKIITEIAKMKMFIKRIDKHEYYKKNCLALAQCQINSEDPLRYFIDNKFNVYFNPKILEKKDITTSKETCLSYPFRQKKKVQRYYRIRVEYYDENMVKKIKDVKGIIAAVFQHEIDHFNAKYIYD